ncbi:hypothetical protein [uncultured Algoriphagus sp.]|uniref:hypothetical protein n=1 Tax=uncultured Algoriphagus sp. TaxID=417365 RepID=UPI0030EEA9AF
MILVITSCVSEEEPVTIPISDVQQAVEEAKLWFGPQEEFVLPMKSGENSRARNQIKKIHWDKAITHENGSVIEVMIEYNFHGVPVKGEQSSGQVSEKEKLSFYRLILKKDEAGGYTKYLMKYFPE